MMATTARPVRFPLLRTFRGKYGRLLAALIVMLASSPLVARGRAWSACLSVVFGFVLLASVYATSPRRWTLVIGLALALAHLVTTDLVNFQGKVTLVPLYDLVALGILLYATLTLLGAVLSDTIVTFRTLQAAVCVYLLIGLLWTWLYALIDLAAPGSIRFSNLPTESVDTMMILGDRYQRLIYFSYCTLSTLGYGDVVPVNGFARIAACFEAMVGQIYVAVLIGRLVGLHISQARPKS